MSISSLLLLLLLLSSSSSLSSSSPPSSFYLHKAASTCSLKYARENLRKQINVRYWVCPTNKSDVLSVQYVIDACFRKIFNVKSKDVVHECETEFGVFPVSEVYWHKEK